MELRFIGTGAAFLPALGNTSAFFTRGENLFLLDCGESVFARLMHAGLWAQYPGNITVILTHTHADHCGSLASLILYVAQVLGRRTTLVHPCEDIRGLLRLMGVQDWQYTLVDSLYEGGLRITPMPALHVPVIPAFSYLLTDETETIYYSGDNGELLPAILDGIQNGEIAHAYQDTNWYQHLPDSPIHLPFQTLMTLVPEALRDRFTLMHFNRDFLAEALDAGFRCATLDPPFQV